MVKNLSYVAFVKVFCSATCPGHMVSVPLCIKLSYLCGVVSYEPVSRVQLQYPAERVEQAVDWNFVENAIKSLPLMAACRLERRPLREFIPDEVL